MCTQFLYFWYCPWSASSSEESEIQLKITKEDLSQIDKEISLYTENEQSLIIDQYLNREAVEEVEKTIEFMYKEKDPNNYSDIKTWIAWGLMIGKRFADKCEGADV